jgi:dephospho-CoA kinase
MKKYKKKDYIVKVIYITAPKDTIFKRVEERAKKKAEMFPDMYLIIC